MYGERRPPPITIPLAQHAVDIRKESEAYAQDGNVHYKLEEARTKNAFACNSVVRTSWSSDHNDSRIADERV